MIKFGSSYSEKKYRCKACAEIFAGPSNCPRCKSVNTEPIPNVLANPETSEQQFKRAMNGQN